MIKKRLQLSSSLKNIKNEYPHHNARLSTMHNAPHHNAQYLTLPSQILCIVNYSRGCDLEKLRGQGLNAVQFQKNFAFPNIST